MEEFLAIFPPRTDSYDCQKTAVVGLDGVGMTQIALEITLRISEKHPGCSIYWVPAMGTVSFRNAHRHRPAAWD